MQNHIDMATETAKKRNGGWRKDGDKTMRTIPFYIGLLVSLFLGLATAPAYAQATRTWVSGVGDDANPCSRTAPCKTFAGAISKTATGGEIDCLDPGGFGAVTITKSLTIICGQSGVGGVLVSGTNGIVVNAPAGSRVVLDGLDIEGLTTGINGVLVVGQGLVTIRNCSIRNFSQNGVNVAGTVGTVRAVIQNSILTGNGLGGTFGGVNLVGAGGGAANFAEVVNSLIDTNTGFNVQVNGTLGTAALVLAGLVLTGTPTNISVIGGGQVISYGNNVLRLSGSPTQTLTLQ
jgi:hypothetical protein